MFTGLRRPLLIPVSVVALTLVGGLSQSPLRASEGIAGPEDCVPLPEIAPVASLDLAGNLHTALKDDMGEVHRYAAGIEVLPPKHWSPVNAPDSQLKLFGYPARPSDNPVALAEWTTMASKYTGPMGAGLCKMPASKGQGTIHSVQQQPGWAGPQAIASGGIHRVYGSARVPSFSSDANCPAYTGSTLALWVGLGNTNGLLQNGWVTYSTQAQNMRPWFEIVTRTGYDTGMYGLYRYHNSDPSFTDTVDDGLAGDLVYSDVQENPLVYDPDTQTYENTVNFAFINWRTGTSATVVINKNDAIMVDPATHVRHDISEAYDGSVGEAIDERTISGGFLKLRKFGSAGWNNTWAIDYTLGTRPIGEYTWNRWEMTSAGIGTIANMTGGNFNPDNESWNISQTSCGNNTHN